MILERVLINRKHSLEEFFNESDLWREVYDIYWKITPIKNRNAALTMMNDVRYICVCINLDDNLEKYLSIPSFRSYMKCAMAYVVFKCVNDLPEKVIDFMPYMYRFISEWDKFNLVEEMLQKILYRKVQYSVDLTPHPELPEKINFYCGKWSSLTNNYDRDNIIRILSMWNKKEHRIKILKMIENEYDKIHNKHAIYILLKERNKHVNRLFYELHESLQGESFLVEEIVRLRKEYLDLKEKYDNLNSKRYIRDASFGKEWNKYEGIKEIVQQLIIYAEKFPSCQNDKAEVIKQALLVKEHNGFIPASVLDEEWNKRFMSLGLKEPPGFHINTLNTEKVIDVHGNENVKL